MGRFCYNRAIRYPFGSTPMRRQEHQRDTRAIASAVVRARPGAMLPSGGED
jgi:hypothetical protein